MEDKRPGRLQSSIQILGSFAAVVAALVSLGAYVVSNPTDLNNWWRRTSHQYSVTIDSPRNNSPIGAKVDISGTANLPNDWNLIVLVQTPGELKYYVTSGGAVTVKPDHHWTLSGVPFGSTDPKKRPDDLNKDYKIVALLVDVAGQTQIEAALARPSGAPFLASPPHNTAEAIAKVHLAP